ncbi:MAG: CbiX/SirB N-terminal domain-containing protein [Deltaproteobacteria bacterium]|nr:CbiX/SirB N-terminal domain-containing protein [Deltaproteobacteria bacterium]
MKNSSQWILLVSHGSRLKTANTAMVDLAKFLQQKLGKSKIIAAFLDLASPSIPEAIDQAVAGQAESIKLFLYFLVEGRHSQEDIPKIVALKQKQYPSVKIEISPIFGSHPDLIKTLIEMLKD